MCEHVCVSVYVRVHGESNQLKCRRTQNGLCSFIHSALAMAGGRKGEGGG